MNVFEAVREGGISARQAAEHCGIKVKRNSMAVCPFHKDKNPSMKIDRRYYCFGCEVKGDAIDFVAKFYGLGKKEVFPCAFRLPVLSEGMEREVCTAHSGGRMAPTVL